MSLKKKIGFFAGLAALFMGQSSAGPPDLIPYVGYGKRKKRVRGYTDLAGSREPWCPSGCRFFEIEGYRIMAINERNARRKLTKYKAEGLTPAAVKKNQYFPYNFY